MNSRPVPASSTYNTIPQGESTAERVVIANTSSRCAATFILDDCDDVRQHRQRSLASLQISLIPMVMSAASRLDSVVVLRTTILASFLSVTVVIIHERKAGQAQIIGDDMTVEEAFNAAIAQGTEVAKITLAINDEISTSRMEQIRNDFLKDLARLQI